MSLNNFVLEKVSENQLFSRDVFLHRQRDKPLEIPKTLFLDILGSGELHKLPMLLSTLNIILSVK